MMNAGYGGNVYGAAQMQYGGPDAFYGSPPPKPAFTIGQRALRRLDCPTVCGAVLVPWFVFVVTYMTLSFKVHYDFPAVAGMVCLATLGFTCMIGYKALRGVMARNNGDDTSDPTWYIFFFWTCLIAWMVAVSAGYLNFVHNMRPYYDVSNLNFYPSVDPANFHGQQMMDAGQISFVDNAHLDLSRSMGFRNQATYCVAPIVTGDDVLGNYDFWAVGLDCCSGGTADFHCGEFNNQNAHAGLRLMDDDQRSFYRLAVQQAEAAYTLEARHPLFFHWMAEPMHELQAYSDDGYKFFLLGIFTFFAVQLFLLIAAIVVLSKFGSFSAPISALGQFI